MSRIGNRILSIPAGVTVTTNGNIVTVKGPKGELSTEINKNITVKIDGDKLEVTRKNDNFKNFHGTANANIHNMIIGVTEGFEKKLEMVGVGYRFKVSGNKVDISAGYSHPIVMEAPEGITVESPSNTELYIRGADKQLVGEFAANIRKIRKPEPYKGKGIRYTDEHVIRKDGKKAA
ncbi:MAG TPA: 50S ribosomal protein L6 [Candidatus Coprosoma intestinipullorum]|uniref:Large ribosomal subunit protein uL6 n=1 Tax=Candidatus Coprosoma intestinipullorum TaxID=2840752 RepID=A0A9D0ZRW1_9FIRM|nr:50S ribosomal protein L6 [Candidatus Coprosoma intestinipullorum]